ncbi:MAG TPA: hypothetical protein VFW76_04120 [Ktedonobacterales bacterium]|nr:hypothetical protein [Ktedonobacterales bacterium]
MEIVPDFIPIVAEQPWKPETERGGQALFDVRGRVAVATGVVVPVNGGFSSFSGVSHGEAEKVN